MNSSDDGRRVQRRSPTDSPVPVMLEVDAEDLEAVYATLEEYKVALRESQEEVAELSAALVHLEDRQVHSRSSRAENEHEGQEDIDGDEANVAKILVRG